MNNKIEDIIEEFRTLIATSGNWGDPDPEGSIMVSAVICDHDSGHMCDCRRDALCKWLENETKSLLIDATIKALD